MELNEKGEIVSSFSGDFNPNGKIKHTQEYYVDDELVKIGYSEQSPRSSVNAFKDGQKKGRPSVRTKNLHEIMKKKLSEGCKLRIDFIPTENNKTPKEQADEKIEKYKKDHNGLAPEWNKQKNHKKWNDNEN